MVGSNEGKIENCFNKGEVVASSDAVAGICGINYKDISNCYNLGKVDNGTLSVGGIVGYNISNGCIIINSINNGDINGENWIGGIVGIARTAVNISNCKSNSILKSSGGDIGGIIGKVSDDIDAEDVKLTNCKWYANSEIKYGIGSEMSNENAIYVEDLEIESVLDIVNGDNDFKMEGRKIVLNWE